MQLSLLCKLIDVVLFVELVWQGEDEGEKTKEISNSCSFKSLRPVTGQIYIVFNNQCQLQPEM